MKTEITYSVAGKIRGAKASGLTLIEAVKSHIRDHKSCNALSSGLTRTYSDVRISRDDGQDLTSAEEMRISQIREDLA